VARMGLFARNCRHLRAIDQFVGVAGTNQPEEKDGTK
jgi:hypothetical protein